MTVNGKMSRFALRLAVGGAMVFALARPATAGRCQSVVGFTGGAHCGLDSDHPAAPEAHQACTQTAIDTLPLKCPAGSLTVVYDLDRPFPADGTSTSHAVIRAAPDSGCAGMADTTIPITGFVVGCWFPPDEHGCRIVKVLNGGAMCLHLGGKNDVLGAGCSAACQGLPLEQIAISNAGAAEHFVCPPNNQGLSRDDPQFCRARRSPNPNGGRSGAAFRLWIGGFCATNGCDYDAQGHPQVGSNTCVAQWGASYLGYGVGKSKALGPGWFDWRSGAFRVDYRNGKATCGALGSCLGTGSKAPWDLSIVAVPRPGQTLPCLHDGTNSCDATSCHP